MPVCCGMIVLRMYSARLYDYIEHHAIYGDIIPENKLELGLGSVVVDASFDGLCPSVYKREVIQAVRIETKLMTLNASCE